MNYRHSYHAGNFADVVKHCVLIALVQSFFHKERGFCYLDTHAGRGYYDLLSDATQKSKEYELGISKLLTEKNPPSLIQDYVACVKKYNPDGILHYYPGSPLIVKNIARIQDRLVLSELHKEEYVHLKKYFAKNFFNKDKQVAIHHQDAYQSLKAFLPPKERRGLILIDPPYEKTDEFSQIISALQIALSRFATGIYAIWYPIKNRHVTERFLKLIREKIHQPLFNLQLCIYAEDSEITLNGCGMLVINPPWKFDQQIAEILPWLFQKLSIQKQGRFTHHFL